MFTFNTKTLSQLLDYFYPSKIYAGNLDARLPCHIISVSRSHDYQIPTEPIESNVFISDHIYTDPMKLVLEIYVHDDSTEEFEDLLREYQFSENGFIVVDSDGSIYLDLRVVSYGTTNDATTQGASIYNLEFIEMRKVESLQTFYVPPEAPPAAAATANAGTKTAEPVDLKSVLFYTSPYHATTPEEAATLAGFLNSDASIPGIN